MRTTPRNGSILVGMLWCLALLSVVVVSTLYTARTDLSVTKHYTDQIQARYLALAGVAKAKAILYQDYLDRREAAIHHNGLLANAPEHFQDVTFSRGMFRVGHGGNANQPGTWTFGIRDEEGRLNLNTSSREELAKLPRSSDSLAAAIVDFRDDNDQVTPGGAESATYLALNPPYLPRNAPFQSVDEIKMVYGMSPELFPGEDVNRNMILDPEENDGEESPPRDNQDGRLDLGWSEWLTIHSAMANVNAKGEDRISIQQADESELTNIPNVTTELAEAIVAYREDNEFQTIASLLDVVPDSDDDDNNGGSTNSNGNKLISRDDFITMSDYVTVGTDSNLPGRVNINSAPQEVLECLPGMTRQLATALVNHRSSSGYFDSVGAVLNVSGMTEEIFKQLCPRIGVRSDTFRILAEGTIRSTRAKKQIEVIVRIGNGEMTTLAYREYP